MRTRPPSPAPLATALLAALAALQACEPLAAQAGSDWRPALPDMFGRRVVGEHPALGITVSTDLEAAGGADGALLTDVERDGPAYRAGLRAGDLVTHVDGRSLRQPLEARLEQDFDLDRAVPAQRLMALLWEPGAEERIDLTFVRDGESRTVTVTARDVPMGWDAPTVREGVAGLGDVQVRMRELERTLQSRARVAEERARDRNRVFRFRSSPGRPHVIVRSGGAGLTWVGTPFSSCPSAGPAADRGGGVFVHVGGCIGGLRMTRLNPDLGAYFGSERGVLVLEVHEDSPLGLEAGDVILAIGDREVDEPSDVHRILGSYEADEEIRFRIRRDRDAREIVARFER